MQQSQPQNFDDFLAFARQQPEPHRLLLVFARQPNLGLSEPLNAPTVKDGEALLPVAIVDKDAEHLRSYAQLAAEAEEKVEAWDVIVVAALPGRNGIQPTVTAIDQGGDKMVKAICNGEMSPFLVFDTQGESLTVTPAKQP